MNFLNRLIAFLIFLLAFIVLLGLAIMPFDALAWLQAQLGHFQTWAMSYQENNPLIFTLARGILGAIAFLVVIPLLLAELPRRKKVKAVKMRAEHGEVLVTSDSIAKRLAWHLDQLADVISVSPQVEPKGDKVHVRLDIETSPEVDVPMKTEEIMMVTRDIIEKDMGLKLGKLRVNLRHAAYPQSV